MWWLRSIGVSLIAAGLVTAGGTAPPPAGAVAPVSHTAHRRVEPTYTNPVVADDAPDPDVVAVGSTYYAVTTGSLNGPIQLFISADLAHWKATQWPGPLVQDAMWTTFGREWAPGVAEIGGQWLLYYATEQTASGQQCVTVATAPTVTGPYMNDTSAPLACGAIDPSPFRAPDGSWYLVWKGHGAGGVGEILSEALSIDGLSFGPSAAPAVLITQTQGWESTVENPDLVRVGDRRLLFYSGGSSTNATYATGYAVCQGPAGPCTKPLDHPSLSSTAGVVGPGGASAFRDTGGRWWLAYAAGAVGPAQYGLLGIRVRSLRIAPPPGGRGAGGEGTEHHPPAAAPHLSRGVVAAPDQRRCLR